MPRPSKGARLWLRPATRDKSGRVIDPARWIIRDAGRQFGTGCGEGDRAEAERKLAEHIADKYAPTRRERDLGQIRIADVINIYLADVVPGQARPDKAAERADRLLDFFGANTLDQITGALCRRYATERHGQGKSNKGTGGGAKRDLEDLRAAINHHAKEGLHRGVVRVVLPEKGQPRQRWMSRAEAARLLWTCWTTPEVQEGQKTDKRPLRHLCRFLLLALYTGSRPGAVLSAAWDRGPGRSWVDLDKETFHRLKEGARETDKRQPPVRLAPRLLAHLRRWHHMDKGRGYVVTFGGQPIESIKTAMKRASELAGIEPVTAYACRHTAATWLVSKGLSFSEAARFLGTSETMIERHYAHFAPDYLARAAREIGRK